MDRSSAGSQTAETSPTNTTLASVSRRLDDVSFGAVLDAVDRPRLCWAAPNGLEVVGCGARARLTATGPDRFERIRDRAERVFADLSHDGPAVARPRAFGGFAFHEEPDDAGTSVWEGFHAASFVIPRLQLTRTDDGVWLTAVGEAGDVADELDRAWARIETLPQMRAIGETPGAIATSRSTTRSGWRRQVERSLERIAAGELEKVVLAQALTVDLESSIDVPVTLERLRRRYPNCYRFAVDGAGQTSFFGAPPERLAAKHGDALQTEALAGSVPRGTDPDEDDAHAARLHDSEKLRREHEFVVDAIGRHLKPVTESISVGDRTVRRLATIQHLRTPITATVDRDRHVLDVVEALHPTPAVGGVPQGAACETIRSVEGFDRGWYAAPVGWFDAAGDGEFAVGIRSAVAAGQTATLFAGNGIVADSDPDEEWAEIDLKFRPILDELE